MNFCSLKATLFPLSMYFALGFAFRQAVHAGNKLYMVIENKKLPGYGDRNCRNELCFIDQEKVDD